MNILLHKPIVKKNDLSSCFKKSKLIFDRCVLNLDPAI